MQIKWAWFERTFEFGFPPEKISDILERLRGTPSRIRAMVADLDAHDLQFQESDTWSIQENTGHLADLEPLWIGRIADIVDGLETMREADLSNRATSRADHNSREIGEVLGQFAELREQLVRIVEILPVGHVSRTALHPRLKKPMRIVDLCHFVAEHDDYHLARMRYLRQLVRQPDPI